MSLPLDHDFVELEPRPAFGMGLNWIWLGYRWCD